MRIIIRGHPQFGHLYPLMPLACAARDAGHEVIFPTTGPFTNRLAALGFRTIQAGVLLEDAVQRRFGQQPPAFVVDGDTAWDVIAEFFAEAAVATATDLRRLLPALDADLVLYENTDLGAAAAAAAVGVASVGVAITRSLPPHTHKMLYGQSLHELQTIFGGLPRPHDPLLDSYPPSLQEPAFLTNPRRIPMRPVPWAEPSLSLPTWVAAHRRRLIFVTLGTVTRSTESVRMIIDGLGSLDTDILIAVGAANPSTLGPLPDNVHADTFVHQANLLPHVDLIIHHGGCGTTTSAWTHGIPQLVLPDGADRFINANAVTTSGSGIALPTPTPEHITKATRHLLNNPTYQRSAQTVRDEIAALPEPNTVLSELLTPLADSTLHPVR